MSGKGGRQSKKYFGADDGLLNAGSKRVDGVIVCRRRRLKNAAPPPTQEELEEMKRAFLENGGKIQK